LKKGEKSIRSRRRRKRGQKTKPDGIFQAISHHRLHSSYPQSTHTVGVDGGVSFDSSERLLAKKRSGQQRANFIQNQIVVCNSAYFIVFYATACLPLPFSRLALFS